MSFVYILIFLKINAFTFSGTVVGMATSVELLGFLAAGQQSNGVHQNGTNGYTNGNGVIH